jgi:hypothetical protein
MLIFSVMTTMGNWQYLDHRIRVLLKLLTQIPWLVGSSKASLFFPLPVIVKITGNESFNYSLEEGWLP